MEEKEKDQASGTNTGPSAQGGTSAPNQGSNAGLSAASESGNTPQGSVSSGISQGGQNPSSNTGLETADKSNIKKSTTSPSGKTETATAKAASGSTRATAG